LSESIETRHNTDTKTISRREFLKKIWIGLGAIFCLELTGFSLWSIREMVQRRKRKIEENLFYVGVLDDFEKGSVTAFINGRFYLCRLDDGGVMAISRKCTHLGCTLPWNHEKKEFICPCHASTFDIRGIVLNKPANRPLDLFQIRIENTRIFVDISSPIKRSKFDQSQVTYPSENNR